MLSYSYTKSIHVQDKGALEISISLKSSFFTRAVNRTGIYAWMLGEHRGVRT